METELHNDTSKQPVERSIQTSFGKNSKHGSANHTPKAGRIKNEKHHGNIRMCGRTPHSRRQTSRRHRTPQTHQTTDGTSAKKPTTTETSQDEVRRTIESFNPKKAPGPDGITSDILKLVFKNIPKTTTSIYNECLKKGYFPTEWKTAKISIIVKVGKENSLDSSKYRPISLLNLGGKVLEKLLIIMHKADT